MSVDVKTVLTTKTVDGREVRLRQETVKQVIQATTIDGEDVLISTEAEPWDLETTTTVVFDDISETPKSIFWTSDVPDAAYRIVSVLFFDGTKKTFSSPTEASKYLADLKPLLSPREYFRASGGGK